MFYHLLMRPSSSFYHITHCSPQIVSNVFRILHHFFVNHFKDDTFLVIVSASPGASIADCCYHGCWFTHLEVVDGVGRGQPGGAGVLLGAERPVEGLGDGAQVEGAHGRGCDTISLREGTNGEEGDVKMRAAVRIMPAEISL